MSGMTKFKVVFLGDEAAGKTSLVRRYMYDTFDESIQATIGMDFQSKTVHLEDRAVRLQLWDTAGQERFRSLIPSYIRDAAAAVVVYDVTKRASFKGTEKWIQEVRTERGDIAVLALVGNKMDLTAEREVATEEGQAQAEELGVTFTETSAKLGDNVAELFQQIAVSLPSVGPTSSGASATRGSETAGGGAEAAGAQASPASPTIKLRAETSVGEAERKKGCAC
mmetsp:Transcript_56734/g.157963  ORF Transcript_56734/g.157963 Transcript_56734/m.157963 type:complete len:224 (+) Transcript_56734:204-875(+)